MYPVTCLARIYIRRFFVYLCCCICIVVVFIPLVIWRWWFGDRKGLQKSHSSNLMQFFFGGLWVPGVILGEEEVGQLDRKWKWKFGVLCVFLLSWALVQKWYVCLLGQRCWQSGSDGATSGCKAGQRAGLSAADSVWSRPEHRFTAGIHCSSAGTGVTSEDTEGYWLMYSSVT